jgi:hypothetical protein
MTLTRRRLINAAGLGLAAAAPEGAVVAAASIPASGGPTASAAEMFLQRGGGAQPRSIEDKLRDSYSAFDFMTPAQIASVRAGDQAEDVTGPLQTAITRSAALYLPSGVYRISTKLVLRPDSRIHGDNGKTTRIMGAHSGVLFEFPVQNSQCRITDICFGGIGCTGITTDLETNDPLRGYLIQAEIANCNFSRELSIGINSSLIFCRIRNTTFGYIRNARNTVAMQAVRSYIAKSNATNLNYFENVVVNNCGDSSTPAIDLYGGEVWTWNNCDFEGCGRVFQMRNLSLAKFEGCWWERNQDADAIIIIGPTHNPVEFSRSQFLNNTGNHIIDWQSGVTQGLVVDNCTFGLHADQYPIYDRSTSSYSLDERGLISWRNNVVTGGNKKNVLVGALGYLERSAAKGWAIVNTRSGSVTASSDPGLVVLRNGTGDVILTASNPIAPDPRRICCVATSNDSMDVILTARGVSKASIQVVSRNAGRALDCTFSMSWFGA